MAHERIDCITITVLLGVLLSACGSTPPEPPPPPTPPPDGISWPLFHGDHDVEAIALGDDGTIYVGGNFTRIGPMSGGGVPTDPGTGAPLPGFGAVRGFVSAAVPDGAGGWYIGGEFSAVGGAPRANLAHLRPDGSVDPDWRAEVTFTASSPYPAGVAALAYDAGVLYLGGHFDTVGGLARADIAAVTAGGQVTSWSPTIDPDTLPSQLVVHAGTVYLSGDFTTVNGEPRAGLAAVDPTGMLTAWNPGPSGPGRPGWVSAMAFLGDTLYVGGAFDHIGGQPRAGLAALDATGAPTSWAPMLETFGDPTVTALGSDGSTLYVGGNFGQVAGENRLALAAFDAAGRLTPWAPSFASTPLAGPAPGVSGLTVADGKVYVAGTFSVAGGLPRNRLAAFDASGQLTSWDPNIEPETLAFAMCVAATSSSVYVGGTFRWLGKDTLRSGLAAILPDGRVTSWAPAVSGVVRTLAVAGGTVYVGGEFTGVGGQPRRNLAAVDVSGTVLSWDPGPDGPVYTLGSGNGVVYAGGRFGSVGGEQRANLVALDSTGRATPWTPQPNGLVTSLAVDGSTVYVGGYFTGVKGLARRNLAAIDASGTVLPWTAPQPGDPTGYAGPFRGGPVPTGVWAVAVDRGTVYFLGDFQTVGPASRDRLAAVDAQGAVTAFQAPILNGTPRTVTVGAGRVLLAGALDSDVQDGTLFNSSLWMVDPGSGTGSAQAIVTLISETPPGSANMVYSAQATAVAARGNVVYVGGTFWGTSGAPRWDLAALDEKGKLLPWNPNAPP
jgi:hypothetical protein